ncbi:hypothetical protein [Flaviaesturariibacter amylovorans]|uniref:Ion transporter n=1 Tax=Flaviaesturariibacter amylovorans TaxID=1084520 RepID=A0ABP8H569_9BACT
MQFALLDPGKTEHPAEKWVDGAVIALILANTVAVILETVEPLYQRNRALFDGFERFSVAFFTL